MDASFRARIDCECEPPLFEFAEGLRQVPRAGRKVVLTNFNRDEMDGVSASRGNLPEGIAASEGNFADEILGHGRLPMNYSTYLELSERHSPCFRHR